MSHDLHSLINQFEQSIGNSTKIATQSNELSRLQSRQLQNCQTTIDKSSRHLEEIDEEINEIDKGFCLRLCCSKKKKNKQSKEILPNRSSEEKIFEIENNSTYSNDQLRNLDENLQKLQFFNRLIDQQIQQQNQTIKTLHRRVDFDSARLIKTNLKTKNLQ